MTREDLFKLALDRGTVFLQVVPGVSFKRVTFTGKLSENIGAAFEATDGETYSFARPREWSLERPVKKYGTIMDVLSHPDDVESPDGYAVKINTHIFIDRTGGYWEQPNVTELASAHWRLY